MQHFHWTNAVLPVEHVYFKLATKMTIKKILKIYSFKCVTTLIASNWGSRFKTTILKVNLELKCNRKYWANILAN